MLIVNPSLGVTQTRLVAESGLSSGNGTTHSAAHPGVWKAESAEARTGVGSIAAISASTATVAYRPGDETGRGPLGETVAPAGPGTISPRTTASVAKKPLDLHFKSPSLALNRHLRARAHDIRPTEGVNRAIRTGGFSVWR